MRWREYPDYLGVPNIITRGLTAERQEIRVGSRRCDDKKPVV